MGERHEADVAAKSHGACIQKGVDAGAIVGTPIVEALDADALARRLPIPGHGPPLPLDDDQFEVGYSWCVDHKK